MKSLSILFISMFTYSFLSGMEGVPASITFSNKKGETENIPGEIVSKSPSLNNAYNRHKLFSSIGTHGRVSLEEPELQNLKLIKECIDYNCLELSDLEQRLSTYNNDIPHLMQIIDMSLNLNLGKRLSTVIAKMIGNQLQSPTNRCQAFKDGILARLTGKPEILNFLAQEIIKPSGAKHYWLQQVAQSKAHVNGLEEQLNNYLTPLRALILVDAYENKVKKAPISYAPGAENMMPAGLRDFIKLSKTQELAYTWKHTKPVYKWSLAGLGAASLVAAGYGLYSWYTAK